MVQLCELTAISPVDGRYFGKARSLTTYFSEHALFYYRVRIEVEYFIALCELPIDPLKNFPQMHYGDLRKLYTEYTTEDTLRIKEIEKITNHDVKAVEYFIKEKFDQLGLDAYKEFIHFGLTSQDINNTALPLSIREANENLMYPALQNLMNKIRVLSEEWKHVPMLARTHGQPASPTRLGKEFYVFFERILKQFELLLEVPYSAKFGGATGNFNAHHIAFSQENWIQFADNFVNNNLGLHRSRTTTQIEHYDNLAAWCDGMKRINTILIDLCRDVWTYISMDYFKQKIAVGEVGSSAMPHKVNPIDFENAEGNLGFANALFEFFSAKLPISRLQRDLTDSTVLRNIGLPISHTLIAFASMQKGFDKLLLNENAIQHDLQKNAAVLAEAIQTILRREGYPNPYEKLKELTRKNELLTTEDIHAFIHQLDVSDKIKNELLQLRPDNYTGIHTF
ncbi:MAG: adenylosuccinate lyase [Candidatus Competibacteraceae bacterium]|nr:adenylosuccinate lyase [Candidatus Competibacteraceae bacterium]